MIINYTLNGKPVFLTERANVVPRKGDVIEFEGNHFKVKNVVWHIRSRTEAEVQIEYYR